jgi:hypothetical protein
LFNNQGLVFQNHDDYLAALQATEGADAVEIKIFFEELNCYDLALEGQI